MNILHTFTRRALWKNRMRTLVTIIGIVLSMALLTAVIEGAYSGLVYMRGVTTEDTGDWHAYFSGLDEATAESVKEQKFVKDVVTTWRLVGYEAQEPEADRLPIFVDALEGDAPLIASRIKEGRMPENDRELILSSIFYDLSRSNRGQEGSRFLAVPTDVSKEEDCKRLIESTIEKFGKIDVLVNNAGISMRAMFKDLELDVIRRLMDVNFWGTVYCTKYALPYLLESKGTVVGVISIAGFKGLPARTGYSASKFAIYGFMDTLRVEHLKDNLNVLIFAPGFTASNVRFAALTADGTPQGQTPREEGKMMSAETCAKKLTQAVYKRKSQVILTPIGKLTVYLNKFFPRWVDRLEYNYMKKEPDSPLK